MEFSLGGVRTAAQSSTSQDEPGSPPVFPPPQHSRDRGGPAARMASHLSSVSHHYSLQLHCQTPGPSGLPRRCDHPTISVQRWYAACSGIILLCSGSLGVRERCILHGAKGSCLWSVTELSGG